MWDIVDEDIENVKTGVKVVGLRRLNRRNVVEEKSNRERPAKFSNATKESNCDNEQYECVFCKQDRKHASTDRNCPEFRRQKLNKEKMGVENISYYEAEQYFRDKTYAGKDPRNFPTLPRQRMSDDNDKRMVVQDRRLLLNLQSRESYRNTVVSGQKRKNQYRQDMIDRITKCA
ncbi:hypothetical protein HHI36_022264 [Cryptolaemus montrouzieri]|uniref:Uncharacterized protein n=1 Tax=Cryptolaemus montrouzieri TaxID=559131 RepID=A0ABD2MZH2_9CUCU